MNYQECKPPGSFIWNRRGRPTLRTDVLLAVRERFYRSQYIEGFGGQARRNLQTNTTQSKRHWPIQLRMAVAVQERRNSLNVQATAGNFGLDGA